jgi:hypothetical protein
MIEKERTSPMSKSIAEDSFHKISNLDSEARSAPYISIEKLKMNNRYTVGSTPVSPTANGIPERQFGSKVLKRSASLPSILKQSIGIYDNDDNYSYSIHQSLNNIQELIHSKK